MWQRGRLELTYLGVDPKAWVEAWERRIARGDALSFGPAILGWDFCSPDTINTSFQASEAFDSEGLAVTKQMRRAIPALMLERGVRLSNTYSLCVDPRAEKWFRLLGLREDKTYRGIQRGPYTTRRFVRSL